MSRQKDNSKIPSGQSVDSVTDVVGQVVDVLRNESEAIAKAADRVDRSIVAAIEYLFNCRGRIIVMGMDLRNRQTSF